MEELTKAIEGIESSAYEWYAIPLILLATGGLITITTGFVQFRRVAGCRQRRHGEYAPELVH